jgi:phytoene dehydrogenase-like protein
MVLGTLGHAVGWPIPKGGSQTITTAMAQYFCSLGGEIETNYRVNSLQDIPRVHKILFDITPKQLVTIAGDALPAVYRSKLLKYRYGPGVFKVDWALSEPIPWRAEECRRAGTVHLGGSLPEIVSAEASVWKGELPDAPFVLLAQQSLFDSSRAPAGKHTAWAYCHVPNGTTVDMTKKIESQIERFAPGFRECILARSVITPEEMEEYNSNYIGGDINGGVQDLGQLFTRPTIRINPYTTPNKSIFLCSSSTPPGGGVHGMCGYHAAKAVLASG